MAQIRRFPLLCHLRAEPNQHVLHFRNGRMTRSGAGLAYWFNPLSASAAQVPVEDVETTFLLEERTSDFQEVAVQCTVIYRCADPRRLAERINFGISLASGAWLESPLERLRNLWSQKAQPPVRDHLTEMPLVEAVRTGARVITEAITGALREDPEILGAGLTLVSLQVNRIAPNPELEKAIQTPTRESIQQKADEAVFQRRALAVEKERAIKQNELATEIELARRQEELIRQEGANRLQAIQQEAAAEKAKVEAEIERRRLAADGESAETRVRADGQAAAERLLAEAKSWAEERRLTIWSAAPPRVALGFALRDLARKLPKIEHLNLTPDLFSEGLQKLLRDLSTRD